MRERFVRRVLGTALPLFLLVLASPARTQDARETLFWESVECTSALEIEAYLETYPNGAYVTEAQTCLVRAKETLFWESVECESRLQVQAYLGVYPSGAYVDEARQCLEQQLGLDRAARILVQQGLASLDYPAGIADGLFGPSTRAALRAWQRGKGFAATGYLTRAQADTLIAQGRDAVTAAAAQQQQEEEDRLAREAAAREEAARQAREADNTAYAEAQRVDTAAAYDAYLTAYPQGWHVQEARERQAQAEQRARRAQAEQRARRAQADDAAYADAERANTLEGYATYLREYPAGQHADEAAAAQRRLRAAAERRRADAVRQQAALDRVLAQINAQMVRVQGGAFTMGCKGGFFGDSHCADDEQQEHRVEVSSFELNRYEVTQEQWEVVMGENPSSLENCPQCPIERVSWQDVQAFLRKVNARDGRYRLPTEAEWEYAARGGQESRGYTYAGSNSLDTVAWYEGNSGGQPRPVGQKEPNELGLYDMSGNVLEWVANWYGEYPRGFVTDPSGPSSGASRVLRGGGWYSFARYCRAASRDRNAPGLRYNALGFRLARTP